VAPNADGSIVVNANDIQVGVLATDAQHGNRGGGALHAVATAVTAGFMSAGDKATLDGLSASAVPSSRTLTAGAGLTGGGDLSADRTFNVVGNADGSIVVNANDIQVGVLATDAQHGNRGGGALHAVATGAVAGFMSAADKGKLDTLTPVEYLDSFTANDGVYPATNPAECFSRNEHGVIAFDDTTDENVILEGVISPDYRGGDIQVHVDWVAATAVVGSVQWDVAFQRIAPGGVNIDVGGFAAVQSGTSVTAGTSGVETRTTITFTNAQADSVAARDDYRIRVTRNNTPVMVGDAQILRVHLEQ
jgi:hypothetical protein